MPKVKTIKKKYNIINTTDTNSTENETIRKTNTTETN